MTAGSVEPFRKLHRMWKKEVAFVDILTRQAHPGPDVPPYSTFEQKLHDAQRYKAEEGIEYPVLVDDLEGTTHQQYGGLADPTYLIDSAGRVAFYNMWTHVPTVHRAIEALMERGGLGVVLGGLYRPIRPLATIVDGWRGVARGWPQSVVELEAAAPGMASLPWLGHQLRPLLAPVALRATPLPSAARIAIAAGAAAGAIGALAWLMRDGGTTALAASSRPEA